MSTGDHAPYDLPSEHTKYQAFSNMHSAKDGVKKHKSAHKKQLRNDVNIEIQHQPDRPVFFQEKHHSHGAGVKFVSNISVKKNLAH